MRKTKNRWAGTANHRHALTCLSIFLAGCVSDCGRRGVTVHEALRARVQDIETIALEDKSRSEPVPVDRAAAELGERVAETQPAAESIDRALADVRAAALTNNLDLKVELVNPSIAQETVHEEQAKFEAVFFASMCQDRIDSPTASELEGTRAHVLAYDAGVRIPLRTGGTVTVNLPARKNRTNNTFSTLNPSYDADLRFSVSQPLLRDAGVSVNTHSIRVARHQKHIADARTELEAIRILANADRAYWLLDAAHGERKVRQRLYELARQQLDQAQKRVAAQAAPRVEITRAESGLAASLEAIIVAETIVRRRERDLKRIMNRDDLPMRSPTALTPATRPNPVGLDLDADALADFAVDNRMEMLELELQLAIDASTIDFERNGTLPLVVLDYTYAINGLGSGFNEAFDVIGGMHFEDGSVQLTAEVPLGNQAAQARLPRAVLQRVQRPATRKQRRLAIQQEVDDAVDQLQQNWQRILFRRSFACQMRSVTRLRIALSRSSSG